MQDFDEEREEMVARQIAARGIRDPRLLAALLAVPREAFVSDGFRDRAYADCALPIEAGQTISQPYIVALMIDAAALGPEARVLEIGAGSGYAAAVMSRLARQVYAIERHEELTRLATARMAALGYDNVTIKTADGIHGWAEEAPFDAILVAAAGAVVPQALLDQLAIGGRLVMPVGATRLTQKLVLLTRRDKEHFDVENLGDVCFVPLVGAQADDAEATPPFGRG